MIASAKHELLFMGIPRCGTNSGYKLIHDIGGTQCAAMHEVIVPEIYATYTIFTFVRNPYDRVASMWNWITKTSGDFFRNYNSALYLLDRDDSFKTFCKWLGSVDEEDYLHEFNVAQYDHLKKSNLLDKIDWIKLEDPILHCLPREKEAEHKSFWELADDEDLALINSWAEKDFEKFNYRQYNSISEAQKI